MNELTALEIACAVAESDGLQLSDYNVSNIEYDVAGVWRVMFRRKGVSGPGNYFFVIVVDADGFATLRR